MKDNTANIKELSNITRKEWIIWEWFEVEREFGDIDRMFIQGLRRTPNEALQAADEWDFLESINDEEVDSTIN